LLNNPVNPSATQLKTLTIVPFTSPVVLLPAALRLPAPFAAAGMYALAVVVHRKTVIVLAGVVRHLVVLLALLAGVLTLCHTASTLHRGRRHEDVAHGGATRGERQQNSQQKWAQKRHRNVSLWVDGGRKPTRRIAHLRQC
jgi:hypothetical protein